MHMNVLNSEHLQNTRNQFSTTHYRDQKAFPLVPIFEGQLFAVVPKRDLCDPLEVSAMDI